jgi:hypothetical protein
MEMDAVELRSGEALAPAFKHGMTVATVAERAPGGDFENGLLTPSGGRFWPLSRCSRR